MIILKSADEISKIRKSSKIVGEILLELEPSIRPGVTTGDLSRITAELMKRKKASPAFKGYRGYPGILCTSINEEIVHGIPSDKRVLVEGDIISIDCGVLVDSFYGDAAKTFPVGKVDSETQRLLDVTREALYLAIEQVVIGNRLQDISWAVQNHVEPAGFSVVRDFVGHGLGRNLHEEPQIPNFGKPHTGVRLGVGMVLAIEPMVNMGTHESKILKDGWTAVTADGRRSAHFEHTVALTESGCEILSDVGALLAGPK